MIKLNYRRVLASMLSAAMIMGCVGMPVAAKQVEIDGDAVNEIAANDMLDANTALFKIASEYNRTPDREYESSLGEYTVSITAPEEAQYEILTYDESNYIIIQPGTQIEVSAGSEKYVQGVSIRAGKVSEDESAAKFVVNKNTDNGTELVGNYDLVYDENGICEFSCTSIDANSVVITLNSGSDLVAVESITVSGVGKTVEPEAWLRGFNCTVTDRIGMNFYMEFTNRIVTNEEQAYLLVNDTKKIELTSVSDTASDNIYKFTYEIPAQDVNHSVTLKFYDSDGNPVLIKKGDENSYSFTYSINDYKEDIVGNDKAKALVDALSTYGAWANSYLNNVSTSVAVAAVEGAALDDLNSCARVHTGSSDITYNGYSLVLEDEVTIKHYFTLPDGKNITNYTFTAVTPDNPTPHAVTPTGSEGKYSIAISHIPVSEFRTKYAVNIGGMEENVSVLSYAQRVVELKGEDKDVPDNLFEMAKALYWFYKATK